MEYSFRAKVDKELKRIKIKDPVLFRKIQKQLRLFQRNPNYPSLRTHKLKGNLSNSWSITIADDLRMVYYKESGGSVVFFDIGTHHQVYGGD